MSIYASIPGLGDHGDDEEIGPPWTYQGSHILPAEDDPRGGTIGLALIPSHITRDGRDNRPDDGRPWPWLRLSLDVPGDDPAVVLNPEQARHLADQLAAWADTTEHPAPEHRYLSTSCLHGQHHYCASNTGLNGAKTPAQCKFCDAPCICHCHPEGTTP